MKKKYKYRRGKHPKTNNRLKNSGCVMMLGLLLTNLIIFVMLIIVL